MDVTRSRIGSVVLLALFAACAAITACTAVDGTPPAAAAAAAPADQDAANVELVGYNDMQGRYALQVTAKSDPANGNWLYVGNVASAGAKEGLFNPITRRREWNGTSILDISDPAHPRYVWHIPNDAAATSRSVSVVYDVGAEKHDYLVRSVENADTLKFQVFDITARDSDPSKIALVSEIDGTPKDSCGRGCGGRFIDAPRPPEGAKYPVPRAHKGYWSQSSGLYFTSANEPGFRSTLLQIWDLSDPAHPRFVSRAWLEGQKLGEPGFQDQYAHHPIVDEPNHRLYAGFRDGSGQIGAWDISDPAKPRLVWSYDTSPPGRGPHTVSPIDYDVVPNFTGDALPRKYALVTDELGNECQSGVKSRVTMFDITFESHPMPVSTYQVPIGHFCDPGRGNFGPHQHAETVNGELNRFTDKIAWLAYVNAGVRVLDISDPYHINEIGHFIPLTNVPGARRPVELTDVDIDHRGLVYASDRSGPSCVTDGGEPLQMEGGHRCLGTGLYVLRYTGPSAARSTSN
ncbi:MAG: LVIVD repeat-containing protein [Vicinamibacterales bacterium]